MKMSERKAACRNIRYELQEGEHTFTMCRCGRHGCRSGLCWECNLDKIFYNKKDYVFGQDANCTKDDEVKDE